MKLTFQQKMLAAAITGVLGTAAGSAFAAIPLGDGTGATDTAAVFAKEIDLTSATVLTGTLLDAIALMEYNLSANNSNFSAEFTLTNAEFKTTPTINLYQADTAGTCTITTASTQGGFATPNMLPSPSTATTADATFTINDTTNGIQGSSNCISLTNVQLEVANHDPITLTFTIRDPNDKAAMTAKTASPYASFSSVLSTSSSSLPTVKTNVTELNTKFNLTGNDGLVAPLCTLKLEYSTTILNTAGATEGNGIIDNTNASDSKLIIKGDFSAAKSGGTSDKTKVYIADNTACSAAGTTPGAADELTDTEATFYLGNASIPASTPGVTVCYKVDGTSTIQESSYTAEFQPKAASGYGNLLNPTAIGDCGKVEKGGTSASLSMALDPNGQYPYFVRVSNPSSTKGKVTLEAYNDEGEKGTGVMEFVLEPGNSTGLIKIADIVAATSVNVLAAKNSKITDAAGTPIDVGVLANKIRIEATAEFGTPDTGTGVRMQGITQSKDKNSFIILAE